MDKKLLEFEVLSHGDKEIFWKKLTSENNWSLSQAKAAFVEYKRFIWLAKSSDARIVPSQLIDTVWHLHMTFTQSYWHDLCRDVLGFELHHFPSVDNPEAKEKDLEGYIATLELYAFEFGEEPNTKYWPNPNDSKTSKPSKVNNLKTVLFFLFTSSILTACSISSETDISTIFKWVIGLYVTFLILKWLFKNHSGGSGGGFGGGSCGSSCGSGCGGS